MTASDSVGRPAYLFPVPAKPLRSLLDAKAKGADVFSEEEATLDVMLAIDRDDLRPLRYYAARWKWSKNRVHRGLDALTQEAANWRTFYADAGQSLGQAGTGVGQAGTETGADDTTEAGSGTDLGQAGTDPGQYRTDPDTRTKSTTDDDDAARAPEAVKGLEQMPADVQAYAEQINDWTAQTEAEQIRRTNAALRAGSLPPASLVSELAKRRESHGPLTLTAALVVTANTARARFPDQRLAFLDQVLETITDHARRSRLAPRESAATAKPGRGRGATRALASAGGKNLNALVTRASTEHE